MESIDKIKFDTKVQFIKFRITICPKYVSYSKKQYSQ